MLLLNYFLVTPSVFPFGPPYEFHINRDKSFFFFLILFPDIATYASLLGKYLLILIIYLNCLCSRVCSILLLIEIIFSGKMALETLEPGKMFPIWKAVKDFISELETVNFYPLKIKDSKTQNESVFIYFILLIC